MSKSMMKAVRVHEYGSVDVLKLEEIERPQPQVGEVLVRIVSSAVIPLDWRIRSGMMKEVFPMPIPYSPGFVGSGIVESVGEGVTGFRKGDHVFGGVNGAYAEYGIAKVDVCVPPFKGLVHMPEALTFEDAATIGAGADTAWKVLFTEGNLEADQTVLIHAAAGGVGQFAVQLAKWKGAKVIGTASSANLDFVKSLGADQVIDYTTTSFEEIVKDVDLVVDSIGGEIQARSWSVLKPGGILVSLVDQPSREKEQEYGVTGKFNTGVPTQENIQTIAQLIADGTIKAKVDRIYSLSTVKDAHMQSESMHGRGRILLSVN